jgi:hypothetical protein
MKKLPIGIQTFSKLIHDNCVYVDKTREIFNLIQSGQYFFISRPRRFGKSLLVSTLYEIFSGNQELFHGLYIYDKIEWNAHPVIHIDLSGISYDNADVFKQSLSSFLDSIAHNSEIELSGEFLKDRFFELIRKIYEKTRSKVVVLIDEYDKPIIDHVDDIEIARNNREVLKNFYGVLKYSDQYLRFVFLTGVSKFSKVSLFSGLNNLEDITIDARFVTIAGITQDELGTYFIEHLSKLQKQEKLSREELVEQIRFWYNGYSWDGVTQVYNPFSLLNLFAKLEFSNYWFASGTPTLLIKKIREQHIDITGLEQQTLGLQGFDSYDIEHLETYPLLFQTGYLTIKDTKTSRRGSKSYILSYPNFEVQESLLTYLLADFARESVPKIQPFHEQMFEYLNSENIEACIQLMQSLFAGIPFPLHIREEAYYHSLFYMILKLLGADVSAEVVTDKGRIDGVLECDERIYIIECKYGEPGRTMETLTQNALRQIHEKKYYEPFLNKGKKILLLGIGFIEKTLGYQVEILKN